MNPNEVGYQLISTLLQADGALTFGDLVDECGMVEARRTMFWGRVPPLSDGWWRAYGKGCRMRANIVAVALSTSNPSGLHFHPMR